MAGIKFYGSQIGGKSVTAHAYTSSPLSLLNHDILSAIYAATYVPYIFWPLWPTPSGAFCELAPNLQNLWACFLHLVLIIMQIPFLLSIPLWLYFPLWMVVLGVLGFIGVNNIICFFLNGSQVKFSSHSRYAEAKKEHENEQWVFLNGVAAGQHWLQSNIDRIALTFGRPVIGLHNKTNGVAFDILQCLIQRNLNFATTDIRKHFAVMKSLLYTTSITKVVFIMHSQGSIEGGMILDWLLQEMPQDLLAKLEVYTFGSAANHFNNPHKHILSQERALSNPTTRGKKPEAGKVIHHIEHYTNTFDFVARWGVLHFINPQTTEADFPRFMGRVFQREGRGHLFGQHYLGNMFPLEPASDAKAGIGQSGFLGADEKANLFMEGDIVWVGKTRVRHSTREGLATSARSTEGSSLSKERDGEEVEIESDESGDVAVFDESPISSRNSTFNAGHGNGNTKRTYKVKDLSRLWQYRNGKSPQIDDVDVQIARISMI